MRVLVAGGGTAGHVWPVLATVRALQQLEPKTEVLYVGSRGPESKLAREAGLQFRPVLAGKFRRMGRWWLDPAQLLYNLRDLCYLFLGILQALWIIWRFRPEVVLAKGGYVALPVGVAAWLTRKPLVIHETDRVMGLANRMLARFATRIAVPERFGPDPRQVETGNPIRPELFERLDHSFFSGESALPMVLVTGGSQGARVINRATWEALPELLRVARVIHLTGEQGRVEAGEAQERLDPELRMRYFAAPFILDEYRAALQQADLMLSRAGGAIYEAMALGVPLILVPIKHSAGDHQRVNAEQIAERGAGVVIFEDDLTARRLTSAVRELLRDQKQLELMRVAGLELAKPDAAERLARLLISVGQEGRRG